MNAAEKYLQMRRLGCCLCYSCATFNSITLPDLWIQALLNEHKQKCQLVFLCLSLSQAGGRNHDNFKWHIL